MRNKPFIIDDKINSPRKEKPFPLPSSFSLFTITICLVGFFSLFYFICGRGTSQLNILCTSVQDCEENDATVYGSEETVLIHVTTDDTLAVERMDEKITKTTRKEELSKIQKRSALRDKYLVSHGADVHEKSPTITKTARDYTDESGSKIQHTRTVAYETSVQNTENNDNQVDTLNEHKLSNPNLIGKRQDTSSSNSDDDVNILDESLIPPQNYIDSHPEYITELLKKNPDANIDVQRIFPARDYIEDQKKRKELDNRLMEMRDNLEEEVAQLEYELKVWEEKTEITLHKAKDTVETHHQNNGDEISEESHFGESEILQLDAHKIDQMVADFLSDGIAYGRAGGYEHESVSAAHEACIKHGYRGLCSKQEVQAAAEYDHQEGISRRPVCYSGWTSEGEVGWYQVERDGTCGGPNRWMSWKPTKPGAHCCGLPNMEVILQAWFQAGCNEKGLLFPDPKTKGTWFAVEDPKRAVFSLAHRAEMGDRISQASCYGVDEVADDNDTEDPNLLPSKHTAEGIIWHLLWECYGNRVENCVIPDAHRLCMYTLRYLHPESTVLVWSKTLDSQLFNEHFDGFDFELRRYDLSLFNDLPERARSAATDISSFFTKHENSFSHWSDLFRSAILYKYGGIYADLDNIWFRPVESVVSTDQWIPATQVWEPPPEWNLIQRQGTEYYLEGGIMRMKQNSPFLKEVLENFPTYNQAMAECWSCVGPRHLTETWQRLSLDTSFPVEERPDLIDSQLIYGIRDYRNNFKTMFSQFDKSIWFGLDSFGCAGAHLFSSSAEGGLKDESLIALLFQIGKVPLTVHDDITWRNQLE